MRRKLALRAALLGGILFVGGTAQARDAGQNDSSQSAQAAPTVHRIRVGGNVQAAKLIRQPLPVYPQIAKTAHISGTVVLHAIIAKDGTVQEVQYISGHPLLLRAATDAVKQWQYEPTLLSGEPVEVDTTISVVFTLGGSAAAAGPAATDIDPQFKADILHLLDVTHATEKAQTASRSVFDSLRPQLLASMPDTPNREKIVTAYSEKLVALFQGDEFKDGMVAVYARYFSDDDVKALAQFYETPAGQHFNEHSSDIVTDSMKIGQQLATENMQRIFSELCKEYPELQGQAQFCPASEDKKSQLLPPATQTATTASIR